MRRYPGTRLDDESKGGRYVEVSLGISERSEASLGCIYNSNVLFQLAVDRSANRPVTFVARDTDRPMDNTESSADWADGRSDDQE